MTPTTGTRRLVVLAAALAGSACTPVPPHPVTTAQAPSFLSGAAPAPESGIVGSVLSDGKPWTRGAVVYLEDAPKQPGVAMTATINVHNKEFTPFISVITTGGKATFANKDNLTHHVFSPDMPNWDTGYLRKDETIAARVFDAPGAFALLCNIHPEMVGYLVVAPSTAFGVVRPDGRYAVGIATPGTYKATLWAPRVQTVTKSVTVASTGVSTLNFDLLAATVNQ